MSDKCTDETISVKPHLVNSSDTTVNVSDV